LEDLPTSEKGNEDGLGDVGSKGEENSFGSRKNFLSCESSKTEGEVWLACSSEQSGKERGRREVGEERVREGGGR